MRTCLKKLSIQTFWFTASTILVSVLVLESAALAQSGGPSSSRSRRSALRCSLPEAQAYYSASSQISRVLTEADQQLRDIDIIRMRQEHAPAPSGESARDLVREGQATVRQQQLAAWEPRAERFRAYVQDLRWAQPCLEREFQRISQIPQRSASCQRDREGRDPAVVAVHAVDGLRTLISDLDRHARKTRPPQLGVRNMIRAGLRSELAVAGGVNARGAEAGTGADIGMIGPLRVYSQCLAAERPDEEGPSLQLSGPPSGAGATHETASEAAGAAPAHQ